MTALLTTVVLASLMGSVHCAAMCGGFIAIYAGTDNSQRWKPHLAYQGARLLVYLILGALAGGLGSALNLAGTLAGWPRLAAAIAGAGMALWGVAQLLLWAGVALPGTLRMPNLFSSAIRHLHSKPPIVRAAVLGASSALLPCGWLWAFVLSAAGTGYWLQGALLMFAFWLGNLPMLLGVGALLQRIAGPARRVLPLLTAITLIVVGTWTLLQRLEMHAPARMPQDRGLLQQLQMLGRSGPTCKGFQPQAPHDIH